MEDPASKTKQSSKDSSAISRKMHKPKQSLTLSECIMKISAYYHDATKYAISMNGGKVEINLDEFAYHRDSRGRIVFDH